MTIGQRSTRQRELIASALASSPGFQSAQEIHEYLAAAGDRVGRATVYRTLRAMATHDGVDVMVRADGETVYRHCSPAHHHHVVCRECGETTEVVGPVVEAWSNQTAAALGYDEVTHTLEVFGRCAQCRDRSAAQRATTPDSA